MNAMSEVPTKSVALSRVRRLIGRTFSVAMLFSSIEVVANSLAFEDLRATPLQLIALVLSMSIIVGYFAQFWFFQGGKFWYAAHAVLITLISLLWIPVLDPVADGPEKPWIWWTVGNAAIAAGLAFRPAVAAVFVVSLPTIWFFVRTSPQGGSAPWGDALQDSIYTLLFSLSISGLLALFQDAARRVDLENHRAMLAAAERARTDAIESERARIDALVHDKVLTTLLVAANSKSPEEFSAAVELADAAVESLEGLESDLVDKREIITANSLFRALKDAVARMNANVEITIDNSSDQQVEPRVADALTEATLQAVHNSLLHAGSNAKRGLKMRTNGGRLKIVIFDTGRGFRVSRISASRLGLRLSIIDRVEKVGGRVFIDTKPGHGTNIILEWGEK